MKKISVLVATVIVAMSASFTSCDSHKSASLKTAQTLTAKLSEVFPDDPVRADYALFGLGISS